MKTLDIHTAAFLGLLRAGLWETEVRLQQVDFEKVRRVAEALPLYAPHARWSRKADRVLARILALGNFGHKRDVSYHRCPRLLRKLISMWRHTTDCAQVFAVCPRNALTVWWHVLVRGVVAVAKGL